jgi:hypothetical protein
MGAILGSFSFRNPKRKKFVGTRSRMYAGDGTLEAFLACKHSSDAQERFAGHCQGGVSNVSEFFDALLSRHSISNLAHIVKKRIVYSMSSIWVACSGSEFERRAK